MQPLASAQLPWDRQSLSLGPKTSTTTSCLWLFKVSWVLTQDKNGKNECKISGQHRTHPVHFYLHMTAGPVVSFHPHGLIFHIPTHNPHCSILMILVPLFLPLRFERLCRVEVFNPWPHMAPRISADVALEALKHCHKKMHLQALIDTLETCPTPRKKPTSQVVILTLFFFPKIKLD